LIADSSNPVSPASFVPSAASSSSSLSPARAEAFAPPVALKAFASRPRDRIVIEGILVRQSGKLDWNYIDRKLRPLAEIKKAPEILTELERRRKELDR
jgi:hypothetical protein